MLTVLAVLTFLAARTGSGASRASLVAEAIAEAINCLAFWIVTMIPVVALLVIGKVRRRRAGLLRPPAPPV